MARTSQPGGLTGQIEALLRSRMAHESAIEQIDATLGRIKIALGGSGTVVKRGRPPGSTNVTKVAGGKKRRRRRGKFTMSGDQSILAFVKSAGSPTTKDVNQHWKSEGRGGSADNALTKLVKTKKLKRINLKGVRGSKYSVA